MGHPNWAEISSANGQWFGAIISLVSATFVILSLIYAARALKAQKLASDVQSMLAIWTKLDDHWAQFQKLKDDDNRSFEFGQLISYYEIACSFFKNDVFTTYAAVTLGEHLRDVIPMMQKNEYFKKLYDQLKTRDDTYENIVWFDMNGQHKLEKLRKTASSFWSWL